MRRCCERDSYSYRHAALSRLFTLQPLGNSLAVALPAILVVVVFAFFSSYSAHSLTALSIAGFAYV